MTVLIALSTQHSALTRTEQRRSLGDVVHVSNRLVFRRFDVKTSNFDDQTDLLPIFFSRVGEIFSKWKYLLAWKCSTIASFSSPKKK